MEANWRQLRKTDSKVIKLGRKVRGKKGITVAVSVHWFNIGMMFRLHYREKETQKANKQFI